MLKAEFNLKDKLFFWSVWILLFSTVTSVHSQQIPNSIQPGRVEQDLNQSREPGSPGTVQIPRIMSPRQQVPPGAEAVKFVLREVEIFGAEVLPVQELEQTWMEYLDTEISLTELYAMAWVMTDIYRKAGYLFSHVLLPAQDIEKGKVRFEVIETGIGNIIVQDANGSERPDLLKYLEPIRQEKPLRATTLERYLLLLNELAGVSARSFLKASKLVESTDLVVVVNESKITGDVSIDSRVSPLLGDAQISSSVSLNNFFGLMERQSLRAITTDTSDLFLVGYSLSIPLGANGLILNTSVSHSRSVPEVDSLPGLRTVSTTLDFGLSYSVIRSRDLNMTFRGGLSGFDSETELNGLISDEYKLRVFRFGLSLDHLDRFRGINLFELDVSRGLREFGALDDRDSLSDNRDFSKFNVYAARLQSIGFGWSLLAAFSGQGSDSSLLSSERFGLGGERFLRAYDGSELLGDSGYGAKLELRKNLSFAGQFFTAYSFLDAGEVRSKATPITPTLKDDAASTGLGLRFTLPYRVSGFVEVAKPLGRDVVREGSRDPRVFGGARMSF